MANGGGGGGHNSVKEHLSAWETRNGFFTSCILSTTLPLVFVGEISLSRMPLNANDWIGLNVRVYSAAGGFTDSYVNRVTFFFIAPKASAEGACIVSKMGYY